MTNREWQRLINSISEKRIGEAALKVLLLHAASNQRLYFLIVNLHRST